MSYEKPELSTRNLTPDSKTSEMRTKETPKIKQKSTINPWKVSKRPPVSRSPSSAKSLIDVQNYVTPKRFHKLKCRRSISLQELSPAFEKRLAQRRKSIGKMDENRSNAEPLQNDKKLVIMGVYCAFLKNAWKKSKMRQQTQQEHLILAENKIKNLTFQVSALKKLLQSDRDVIANLMEEMGTLKKVILATTNENINLSVKFDALQGSMDKAIQEKITLKTELMNTKNTCQMAKSEALAYETQLKKEREKLAALKNENRELSDKVHQLKEGNDQKCSDILELSDTIKSQMLELITQRTQYDESEKQALKNTKKLSETQKKLAEVEAELHSANLMSAALNLEISRLESSLSENMDKCETLNNTVKQNCVTIIELNTALETMSTLNWKSKFFSTVNSVIEMPLLALKLGSAS